ncbi:MAG: VPLPA-CTERM sorting domain-containing protein [Gammaproteobacteria bacterium]|nr:VPLPA-CTERM sorting domain-containing protein [Gammaproteobacteria bacterium]
MRALRYVIFATLVLPVAVDAAYYTNATANLNNTVVNDTTNLNAPTLVAESIDASSGGHTANAQIVVQAEPGFLTARSTTSSSAGPNATAPFNLFAEGSGSFTDSVMVNVSAGTLRLQVDVNAIQNTPLVNSHVANGAAWRDILSATEETIFARSQSRNQFGELTQTTGATGPQFLDFSIIGGEVELGFGVGTFSRCGLSVPNGCSADATVDLQILGGIVLDNSGDEVTNALATSASGFDYLNGAPVPLPAGAWLMLTALTALGVVRRKQFGRSS